MDGRLIIIGILCLFYAPLTTITLAGIILLAYDSLKNLDLMLIRQFLIQTLGSTPTRETGVEERKRGAHHIKDHYESLTDLSSDLRKAGLESSRMIIGIDYTASNEYGNGSLHAIVEGTDNPYQSVMKTMADTLSRYDETGKFLCFGFGDVTTQDRSVFNLHDRANKTFSIGTESRFDGINHLLKTYSGITPTIQLSGPTSFSPIIRKAISIAKEEKQYYILVIITDGQTTTKEEDERAIIEASKYPISIICIGVGDGPWNLMEKFDDNIKGRRFDNFQFVEFNSVRNKPTAFAVKALMEIPEQFAAVKSLGYLKRKY